MGSTFDSQLPEEPFDLITRQRRQHLQQVPDRCPFRAAIGQVLHQQRLVGLPVQAALPCIGAGTAQRRIEGSGQKVLSTPSSAPLLHGTCLDEARNPVAHGLRQRLFTDDGVQSEKVMGREIHEFLVAKSFQEAHERRVPDAALQRQTNLVGRRAGEVRQRFTLANGGLDHDVETLPRPFHQTDARQASAMRRFRGFC